MRLSRDLLQRSVSLLVGASLACVAAFECLAQSPAAAPRPRIFDAYEYGTPDDDARLDRFAAQLRREPRARAYVIAYSARRRRYNATGAGLALQWVRNDLEQRGIKPGRVVSVEGGIREKPVVELWVVPHGAPAPAARPTAEPGEVVFCPDIFVNGEQYVFRPSGPLEFTAHLANAAPSLRPTFEWEVFGGRLVGGQGADTIKVEPTGARVIALVEVGGLSPECADEARVVTDVGVIPYRLDEYGNIRIGDEKARLDHLAVQLQREPGLRAYLIGYGGRRGRRGDGEARAGRAQNYLVNARGIPEERIVTINGGYREEVTLELWLATAGGELPAATPTVDEKYVRPRTGRR